MKLLIVFLLMTLTLALDVNPKIQSQPNGRVYYSSERHSAGRDIWSMDSTGGSKTRLTSNVGNGHYPHNNNPKLSPDGTKIVYQSDPDRHDQYTIWTMNTDGSNQKKITQKEGLYPQWDPTGENIIFSGRRNGIWEILTVSVEEKTEKSITNNYRNEIRPGWGATCSFHPNGKSIIYTYITEKILYKLNLETQESERISPVGSSYVHPIYSKDGLRIAVNRKYNSGYDLVVISPGGEEDLVAKNVISYSSPAWSNSENSLLFVGMVRGNQEIFKIDLETGAESQLTNNETFDAMPTWK